MFADHTRPEPAAGGADTPWRDTTIVVPTLNEEANIGRLLAMLLELYPGIHVTVADDGSTDRTGAIVRGEGARHASVTLLDRASADVHGLTASVCDAALQVATPYFIVMDGDLQHPPEKVKDLRASLAAGADVVVGRRDRVLVPWPTHRRIVSRMGVLLGRARLQMGGAATQDTMSGFFGARTELFKRQVAGNLDKFELRGYKVLFDFLKLLPRGTVVDEVPYDFGLRAGGTSKISSTHLLLYARSLFRR